MDGKAAVAWIKNLARFGSKPGLVRMEWIMEQLGHPEKKISAVHVAGTNGKGSTCHILAELLMQTGHRVGLFTSPFVDDFCESMMLNRQSISYNQIGDIVEVLKPLAEKAEKIGLEHPTQFEVVTALSFCYFQRQAPDIVILETGLGGRLDATNIIDPLVSIITSVGYDHIQVLGDSLTKIAREKAGIIKKGKPVLTSVMPKQEGFDDILHQSKTCGAALFWKEKHFYYDNFKSHGEFLEFDYHGLAKQWHGLRLSLLGSHQADNACLALAAFEILDANRQLKRHWTDKAIYEALKQVNIPLRLEFIQHEKYKNSRFLNQHFFANCISSGNKRLENKRLENKRLENVCPDLVLDAAHNPEAVKRLTGEIDRLRQENRPRKIIFLMGLLADKEVDKILTSITCQPDGFVITEPENDRALSSKELVEKIRRHNPGLQHNDIAMKDDILTALKCGLKQANGNGLLVVFGSFYLATKARRLLLGNGEAFDKNV